MRRLTFLLAASSLALGLAAQAADTPSKVSPLNQRILNFCKKSIGKQVGDGQCADLAYQAMLAAGAESPDDFKDDPKPGDYVWGQFVYGHRIENGDHVEKGDRMSVQPGDIVQMRDVIIEHEEEDDDYITKETIDADHHTAVVSKVSPDGMTYDVIEQNANDEPTVTTGKLRLDDMKKGYILVYRAVTDDTPDGDPGTETRLQGQTATVHHRSRRTIYIRHTRTVYHSRHVRKWSTKTHRARRSRKG